MPESRKVKFSFSAILIPVLMAGLTAADDKSSSPVLRYDLKQSGFINDDMKGSRGDYSGIVFVSDSLLLAFVSQRLFVRHEAVGPDVPDDPPAHFVLIDPSTAAVLRRGDLRLQKSSGVVFAVGPGQFVILTASGLRLCTTEFKCGLEIGSEGPIFASPSGQKLVVGGNRRTDQVLLDSETLKPVQEVGRPLQIEGIPGDTALLVRDKNTDHVRIGDVDIKLPFNDVGMWPSSRFVADDLIAGFGQGRSFVVAGFDGEVHYTRKLKGDPWRSEFVTSSGKSRFAISERGYTRINSALNLLDIDEGRPPDWQRISVFDARTGALLFEKHFDPRPFFIAPSLSPNGHLLAIIDQGLLEVFPIP